MSHKKKQRTAEQLAHDKERRLRAHIRKQERRKAARALRASQPQITYPTNFSTDWIVDVGPDLPPFAIL